MPPRARGSTKQSNQGKSGNKHVKEPQQPSPQPPPQPVQDIDTKSEPNEKLQEDQTQDVFHTPYAPDYLFELFRLIFLIGHLLIQNFNVHLMNLEGYNTSYIAFTAILFTSRVSWKFVLSAWSSNNTITVGLIFRVLISLIPTLYLVKMFLTLGEHHDIQTLLFLFYPSCLYFSLFPNVGFGPSETFLWYNSAKGTHDPAGIVLNFRHHIKSIIYCALETGYYTTILPIRFLLDRNSVYDQQCGVLIAVYGILNTFILLSSNLLSCYSHDFYLQARSIGCWSEIKRTSVATPWSENDWPQGSQVRYKKKTYIAQGQVNTAEPDDWVAYFFYKAFRNPRVVATNIVYFEVGIVATQFMFLLIVRKWEAVAEWAVLTGFSYIVLCYVLVVRRKIISQAKQVTTTDK
eukprot:m.261682 g.261682  ORF g.261682 m.261682 type:complete len:404 (-) comp42805_c0_seq1:70-1281(-)